MANGKGSKQRVRWSKEFEDNYNNIFRKKKDKKMNKKDNTDKCVMCGANTEYTKDTHIDFRTNYVEGAGQMCNDCHTKIY
tara:strand:+ start:728 stop:967 length:240 start_codon:yes stop_codon:yes gene_type:complete